MDVCIALCSINPTVGDLNGNTQRILAAYRDAAARGADIVVTPEMSLTGYPLEDLTQKPSFLAAVAQARIHLAKSITALGSKAALVYGHPTDTGIDDGNRRLVYNSATFFDPAEGTEQIVHKRELPNYGVFDEKRNYLEGPHPRVINWRRLRLSLLICEDGWFPATLAAHSAQGADAILWINGSPYANGKNVLRRHHAQNRIAEAGVPLAYVNLVGGQDELVFDGDSFAYDGEWFQQSALFHESIQMVEWKIVRGQAVKRGIHTKRMLECTATGPAQSYGAIVLGIADYLGKSRFGKVLIGYSGGVDSGLVAAMACDALGPENVLLVRLPSKYSSEGSLDDAWEGAKRLGCELRTICIEPAVDALRALYAGMQFDIGTPIASPMLTGVSDENLQARVRGDILMAISNQEGRMLLNTTNRSEGLTGYGTLHGDMAGGFGPLKDVLKTDVWKLCRYRNSLDAYAIERLGFLGPVAEVVPEAIIVKPPSAELSADQKDTDSLPPYEVLDPILISLVDREMSVAETVDTGIAPETVVRRVEKLVFGAEYKRRLAAPGVKTGDKLLGRDRRYPIVNGFRT